MFKRSVTKFLTIGILSLIIGTFFNAICSANDVEFEVTTPKANFLRLIAREKTNIVFDQEINLTNFTGTKQSHSSLKVTDDVLLFKYKGSQGLKIKFAINGKGDIQTVEGNHETAFKDKKVWGFKTPGKFINAVPSLFYKLNINANETHNCSLLKAYTGDFGQSYLFNDGVIHFGNLDDCMSLTPYVPHLDFIKITHALNAIDVPEPSFKYGVIDDYGMLICEKGLEISNLTHKVYGITDITGPLSLNNAGVENHNTYHVEGPLQGKCHDLTNYRELFLQSTDNNFNVTNMVNHGRIDIANDSTLSVSNIFDNGLIKEELGQTSKLGIINCGGSFVMQLAKAPKGLGIVTAGTLKAIIDEFLDEEAVKNAFKNAALLPKNRKFVRKVTTHVDHYLNTITQHRERDQYGFTRDTHKTETGYKFQKRDTSIHEQTIDTPEWPKGITDDNSTFANKRDFLKRLKDHIKEALKKLGQGQAHKSSLAMALQEALGEAGLSGDDIDDFFDDSEIQGLLNNLGEFNEDILKALDDKLKDQSELSRGNLVESLLNPTQVIGHPLNRSLEIIIPAQRIHQSVEILTPRRSAAKLGYAKAIQYFDNLNHMTREELLRISYGPENMARDYYNQAQREIVQAALWKGITGKPINAYEQGVVADFNVDLAMTMADLGIDIAEGIAEGASMHWAGKGISFCLKKAFGKFVTTAANGVASKGYTFVNEIKKKSGNIFKIKNPVWNEAPAIRGEIIEKHLGQNLPQNFPVIDKFVPKTGTVTSIKSLDLNAKTYQDPKKLKSVLERYIDKLADFKEFKLDGARITTDKIKQRALDLAVPHSGTSAQQKVLQEMFVYAKNKSIEFNLILY